MLVYQWFTTNSLSNPGAMQLLLVLKTGLIPSTEDRQVPLLHSAIFGCCRLTFTKRYRQGDKRSLSF